jgi:hypothetical protein
MDGFSVRVRGAAWRSIRAAGRPWLRPEATPVVYLCELAQLRLGAAQDSRYLHLGDTDLLGDLGLRHVTGEPQGEPSPLAGCELACRHGDHRGLGGRAPASAGQALLCLLHLQRLLLCTTWNVH